MDFEKYRRKQISQLFLKKFLYKLGINSGYTHYLDDLRVELFLGAAWRHELEKEKQRDEKASDN